MKVLDSGHLYQLNVLDGGDLTVELRFVKREGPKFPGNVGHYPGTNLQEVLRALINRVYYLDSQEHDDRNLSVIDNLHQAVYLLEERAAHRHGRRPPTRFEALYGSICNKCQHVGCPGTCH